MTKDEAIELAYEVAMTENWTWIEPVSVYRFRRRLIGPLVWRVLTNIHFRGMNVRVLINDATGEVIQKGYLPR